MNKFLLFALMITTVFVACKKDDIEDSNRTGTFEQRVAKSWNLTDVQYEGYLPNPLDPNQGAYFTGEGEDVFGTFDFEADGTAEYAMGFTARIDVGGEDPVRLPFFRPGEGVWWIVGPDSIIVAEAQDTIGYRVREDTDTKQRWTTVLPIKDTVSNTFVDVTMQVILRR